MKRFALLLVALVLLTGALIGFVALRPVAPAVVPPPVVRPSAAEPVAMKPIIAPPPAPPAPSPAPETTDDETAALDALPPLIADAEEAKARVLLLANTFDEAHVPELARYLAHASAEVRTAALNALLVIDDAAAVPHLRAAAQAADTRADTLEAVALREAADILAAPRPASEPHMPKTPLVEGAAPISVDRDTVSGAVEN